MIQVDHLKEVIKIYNVAHYGAKIEQESKSKHTIYIYFSKQL